MQLVWLHLCFQQHAGLVIEISVLVYIYALEGVSALWQLLCAGKQELIYKPESSCWMTHTANILMARCTALQRYNMPSHH